MYSDTQPHEDISNLFNRSRGSKAPSFTCPDFSGRDKEFPAGTGRETGQNLV